MRRIVFVDRRISNGTARTVIHGLRVRLIDEVAQPEQLLDVLLQENIVNVEESEATTNASTRFAKCRRLLDLLWNRKHPRTFVVLLQALKAHYSWLADEVYQKAEDIEREGFLFEFIFIRLLIEYQFVQWKSASIITDFDDYNYD